MLDRRDFLRVGTIGGFGLGSYLQLQSAMAAAAKTSGKKTDVNCIFIFILGGMSHHDMWDLKPEAPKQIAGPFRPIETNVPGVEICEEFPMMARMMDKFA